MKVYQIYFDKEQYKELEPSYIPYFNPKCTVFFEAEVIRKLVEAGEHLDTDYFGVVSYKLRSKLGYIKENWKNNKNIANISTAEFTPEKFEEELMKHKPDVMSFQRHAPHDPVAVANQFHPGFKSFWEAIMKGIGYQWIPERYEDIVYCHYMVMKPELYQRYVKEMLAPAMDFMKGMPELYNDSGYRRGLLPENLKKEWGINHYSFHAFLTERMPSYFIHIHKLNCKHY